MCERYWFFSLGLLRQITYQAHCSRRPFRLCRGATAEGSRGLQPTVEYESGRRRGATHDVPNVCQRPSVAPRRGLPSRATVGSVGRELRPELIGALGLHYTDRRAPLRFLSRSDGRGLAVGFSPWLRMNWASVRGATHDPPKCVSGAQASLRHADSARPTVGSVGRELRPELIGALGLHYTDRGALFRFCRGATAEG